MLQPPFCIAAALPPRARRPRTQAVASAEAAGGAAEAQLHGGRARRPKQQTIGGAATTGASGGDLPPPFPSPLHRGPLHLLRRLCRLPDTAEEYSVLVSVLGSEGNFLCYHMVWANLTKEIK